MADPSVGVIQNVITLHQFTRLYAHDALRTRTRRTVTRNHDHITTVGLAQARPNNRSNRELMSGAAKRQPLTRRAQGWWLLHGMERNGTEWNGMERNGTELRSKMRNGTGLKCGTVHRFYRFTVVLCILSLFRCFDNLCKC